MSDSGDSSVVRLLGVCRHFGTGAGLVRAVDEVDLDVVQGTAVMVTGPSGCGKTTLLQLIGGLDLPTSGQVWVDGTRIDVTSETQRARLRRGRVGFVFQDFNLLDELTALENIELPAVVAGVSRPAARRRALGLLEEIGLAERRDHRPAALSGGQRQRVAVARALVNEPRVLLADEPTGNLDSRATSEVLRLLDGLRRQGQTLVIVTHDQRAAAVCDRMLVMRDGALVDDVDLEATGGRDLATVRGPR